MADCVVFLDDAPLTIITRTTFRWQERSEQEISFVLAKFVDTILAWLARFQTLLLEHLSRNDAKQTPDHSITMASIEYLSHVAEMIYKEQQEDLLV